MTQTLLLSITKAVLLLATLIAAAMYSESLEVCSCNKTSTVRCMAPRPDVKKVGGGEK